MLECLEFIFSSFWVWLGTAILLHVIRGGTVFKIYKNKKDD
jgi:hypothetical protein